MSAMPAVDADQAVPVAIEVIALIINADTNK